MIEFFPSREIFLTIGPLALHWYGLMYALAFIVGIWIFDRIQKHRNLHLTRKQVDSLVVSMLIGVVAGGRLGFVLFYAPEFLVSPMDLIAVWHGGMSSHGGIIGVTIMLWIFCKRNDVDFREIGDVLMIPVAIGLAFGRFGNFINQELYGSITTLPWGIEIPGEEGLRHPTQIYAMMKDLFIASMCYVYLTRIKPIILGRTVALFFMSYGMLRFMVEFLRVQTAPPFSLGIVELTRGQLLTIPVFLIGVVLWFSFKKILNSQF